MKHRKPRSRRVRRIAQRKLQRLVYAQNDKCQLCGDKIVCVSSILEHDRIFISTYTIRYIENGQTKTEKYATIEHIMPVSRGGTNDDDNLIAVCSPCNEHRIGSDDYEFQSEWGEQQGNTLGDFLRDAGIK